jgi:tetratricopeptide (TPR) repeat protein
LYLISPARKQLEAFTAPSMRSTTPARCCPLAQSASAQVPYNFQSRVALGLNSPYVFLTPYFTRNYVSFFFLTEGETFMMYRLAVVCLFALELRAQISGDEFRAVVRGHLVTDGSSNYDAYTVSLYCPSSGRPAEQAHVDPAFAQARSDLAAQYIDLKRYPEAFVQLAEASRLDPASATIALNSAICLERVGDLERAEAAARRAVALNGLSSHAQFALGIILVERKKFTDETVQILIASGEAYPVARLTAAQILAAAGRPLEARDQLRGYLKNCDGKDRRAVETWLARLNMAP